MLAGQQKMLIVGTDWKANKENVDSNLKSNVNFPVNIKFMFTGK